MKRFVVNFPVFFFPSAHAHLCACWLGATHAKVSQCSGTGYVMAVKSMAKGSRRKYGLTADGEKYFVKHGRIIRCFPLAKTLSILHITATRSYPTLSNDMRRRLLDLHTYMLSSLAPVFWGPSPAVLYLDCLWQKHGEKEIQRQPH